MVTVERAQASLGYSLSSSVEFGKKEKRLIDQFETGLISSKPYLFGLADKLIQHYPERKWDILIVDDKGARLPSRFIRKVLEGYVGIPISTYFIQSGNLARRRVGTEKYLDYVHYIAYDSNPSTRPLVITESTDTFKTADFIGQLLSNKFHEVDLAAVSWQPANNNWFKNVYMGGEGQRVARAIYNTFEGGKKKSIFHLGRLILPINLRRKIAKRFPHTVTESTHRLTGLKDSNDPYVAASRDTQGKALVSYFYRRMNLLAEEYLDHRHSRRIAFPTAA